MKTTILAIALLFSLFTVSACGRDDYSDKKKDTSATTRSSTETSSGAASREAGEKGQSGVVTSSGTAETVKTKQTSASGGTSPSPGESTTSSSPDGRSTVASATRSDKDQTSKSQTIEGLLLKIEGDSFLVKDISGKEVKLTADSNTKKDGNLTIGDRIVARVEDRGTLASINKR